MLYETGFSKKGMHSAGGWQYCGTLGWVGNCQVRGFLAYVGSRGHTLLDRDLYLSEPWTEDPSLATGGGVGPRHIFTPKPQLVQRMLERVLEAGLHMAWVMGDTIYGWASELRRRLEDA